MRGVRRVKEVPHQAWLLKLAKGRLTGVCGKRVTGGSDWLYEGGWAETDTPRSLSPSGVYLGSGAVWDGKTLSLISPSHTADAVYVLERPGEIFASNSLPFMLAGAKVEHFPIRQVRAAMITLLDGIDSHQRMIHSGPKGTFHRFFNAIVTYDEDVGLVEHQQSADLNIESFEDYRAYLLSVIRQAARSYGSTGTSVFVSRGYDSVACAALAAAYDPGASAICIDTSREGVPDDGTEVAKALGIKPVLLKRRARPKVDRDGWSYELVPPADYDDIAEFYLGMSLFDECLRAPPELLAGRMVLTGFHGDKIWDLKTEPAHDLVRGDTSGASLGEYRIRIGFLHVPVPMLAFRAAPKLQEIARSEAMQPWRLNNDYDRPIPRRIAEEAGVPREMFGQAKQAAAMVAANRVEIGPKLFRLQTARYKRAAKVFRNPPARRVSKAIARSLSRLRGDRNPERVL